MRPCGCRKHLAYFCGGGGAYGPVCGRRVIAATCGHQWHVSCLTRSGLFLFSSRFPCLPACVPPTHVLCVRACAACSRSRPLEEQRGLWPCTPWPPYKQHHTPTQVQLLVLDSRTVRVEPDPGRAGRAGLGGGGSLALWCVVLSCHVASWLGTRPVCQWGPTRDWQSWSVLALCGLRAPGL